MVVFTAAALILGGLITYFTIGAVAALAHWVAVIGGFTVFAGLTYNIVENNWFEFIGFESRLVESLSAGVFSAAVGVVSFQLFEAVFGVLGWTSALVVVVLAGASVVFGPALVASFLGNVLGGIVEVLGGE